MVVPLANIHPMTGPGISAFTLDLGKFLKHVTDEALPRVKRFIALKLYEKIILRTPVLTGRLVGSWFMYNGSPQFQMLDRIDKGDELGESAARAIAKSHQVRKFIPFVPVWIVNNIPYAQRIEFEGHSKAKAPAGMMLVSLAEIEAELLSVLGEP